jgi:hypothetical protein
MKLDLAALRSTLFATLVTIPIYVIEDYQIERMQQLGGSVVQRDQRSS